MEDKIVKTANGYTVIIRPFISYPKFIEFQKLYTDGVTIDPNDENKKPEMKPLSVNTTYEVEEKINRYLVKSVADTDGKELDLTEDYLPIPPKDYEEVKKVLDEISKEAQEAFLKKK